MRTLIHLSDLHFGRINEAVIQPLIDTIGQVKPDLIAVSGDLTQRARRDQFQDAQAFLRALPFPQIVVPGNHDVPFYNVYARFLLGLSRYRRYITDDLEPFHADSEVAVLGLVLRVLADCPLGRAHPGDYGARALQPGFGKIRFRDFRVLLASPVDAGAQLFAQHGIVEVADAKCEHLRKNQLAPSSGKSRRTLGDLSKRGDKRPRILCDKVGKVRAAIQEQLQDRQAQPRMAWSQGIGRAAQNLAGRERDLLPEVALVPAWLLEFP